MAYFKHNEPEETRRNRAVLPDQEYETGYAQEIPQGCDQEYEPDYDDRTGYETGEYEDYDDGFDEPEEEYPRKTL